MLAHEDAKADSAAAAATAAAATAALEADEAAAEAAAEAANEQVIFSPERGNVVFGSAYDGWAFRIDQFAEMYAGGLGDIASDLPC